MPTHVRLDRRSESTKGKDNQTWQILSGIIENRDLQIVVLFCLLGLVSFFTVAFLFPNLGTLVVEYNQF
jgi:hypothetical protein